MSGIVGSYFNTRGSGVVAKLGTDGQVFTSTGAGLSQGFEAAAGGGDNTPAFLITYAADQTGLTDNTATKIVYDTAYYDSGSVIDTSNGRFTVPSGEGGQYYLYTNNQVFKGSDMQSHNTFFYKNGSAFFRTGKYAHDTALSLTHEYFGSIMTLAADDYIEVYLQMNVGSGTGDLANSNNYNNFFGGFKILN